MKLTFRDTLNQKQYLLLVLINLTYWCRNLDVKEMMAGIILSLMAYILWHLLDMITWETGLLRGTNE